jgi:hypothetical protein
MNDSECGPHLNNSSSSKPSLFSMLLAHAGSLRSAKPRRPTTFHTVAAGRPRRSRGRPAVVRRAPQLSFLHASGARWQPALRKTAQANHVPHCCRRPTEAKPRETCGCPARTTTLFSPCFWRTLAACVPARKVSTSQKGERDSPARAHDDTEVINRYIGRWRRSRSRFRWTVSIAFSVSVSISMAEQASPGSSSARV